MSYTPISMPNSEAQFLETRKFQVSEICRIYRVPPHMVGDLEHATFSNIEHQSISFAVHTIRPVSYTHLIGRYSGRIAGSISS